MKDLKRTLGNEKGVAVPMMAVALLVLVGFTGLGVDVGRLGLVADETQNAADIAATAGAMQLFAPSPSDPGASPRNHAENLLARNTINNTAVSPSHLTVFETGNYANGNFTANLPPINAVRAQVQITVNNLIFAGIGFPTSLVTKEAIAAFDPVGGGQPTLPLTIGECLLGENCNEGGCDVVLTQVPDPEDNSAFTGFFQTASAQQIEAFFPQDCLNGNQTHSDLPYVSVGDFISLLNGQSTGPLLGAVQCLVDLGMTEALVPITECGGQLNQTREVLGFATFEILSVITSGGNKGITIQGLTAQHELPGGGEDFGSGTITMVR